MGPGLAIDVKSARLQNNILCYEERTKRQIIESLAAQLKTTPDFYIVNIEGLNAEKTSRLRRQCFEQTSSWLLSRIPCSNATLEQAGIEEMKLLFPILKVPRLLCSLK
jgi:large subunit ribosomal protein L10